MSDSEEEEVRIQDSDDNDLMSENEVLVEYRTLSKSWSVISSHVPTFTGGKVTASKSEFLLLPVHGDLAVVDAKRGVKVTTLRGDDALVDDEDEDEGLDQDAITSYALDHNDKMIITCARNNILRQYTFEDDKAAVKLVKTWGRSRHSLPVMHLAFHVSNVFLATGSVDGTVRIWDFRGSYVTHVFRPYEGGESGEESLGDVPNEGEILLDQLVAKVFVRCLFVLGPDRLHVGVGNAPHIAGGSLECMRICAHGCHRLKLDVAPAHL